MRFDNRFADHRILFINPKDFKDKENFSTYFCYVDIRFDPHDERWKADGLLYIPTIFLKSYFKTLERNLQNQGKTNHYKNTTFFIDSLIAAHHIEIVGHLGTYLLIWIPKRFLSVSIVAHRKSRVCKKFPGGGDFWFWAWRISPVSSSVISKRFCF